MSEHLASTLEKYAIIMACIVGAFLVAKDVYFIGPEVFYSVSIRVLISVALVTIFAPRIIRWMTNNLM